MLSTEIMRTDFVSVDQSDSLSTLIGKLGKMRATRACVFSGDDFVGMFSYKNLLKTRLDATKLKVSNLVMAVPHLSPDMEIPTIVSRMYDSGSSALPVVKDGKIIGVVTFFDIIKHLGKEQVFKTLKIDEIKRPVVKTVTNDERIDTVLSIMRDNGIDRLPVISPSGELEGIITHTDVMMNYYANLLTKGNSHVGERQGIQSKTYSGERDTLSALPVRGFMSKKEIVTIDSGATASKALSLMADNQIKSLVVMVKGAPSYIVTSRDFLDAYMGANRTQELNIHFKGLEDIEIDEFTKARIHKVASYHAEKINHIVKNDFDVEIYFKENKRVAKSHMFSVNIKVTYPGGVASSEKTEDYDVLKAVHEAFRNMLHVLQHKHKADNRKAPSARQFF